MVRGKRALSRLTDADAADAAPAELEEDRADLAGRDAELADGAHPYNVTPEHTRQARSIIGKNKLLCVEQAVILEQDPATARAIGRKFLGFYMGLPNYVNNWRRLGFGDTDFAGGGSDRLIDAVIAWGDEKAIRGRIDEHWQAGADHVCVQAVGTTAVPDERVLSLLAPGV